MATSIVVSALHTTHCPLCGSPVLSVARGGRLVSPEMRAIPLGNEEFGRGYTLCDDCGILADLPADLTLN